VEWNDYWWNEKHQFLIVPLKSKMTVGMNYSLYTEFEGNLADDLGGLYRSSYEKPDGTSL